MGLIRMTKTAGREKPCNSQGIFTSSGARSNAPEPRGRMQAGRFGGGRDLYGGGSRLGRGGGARRGGGGYAEDRMRGWGDDDEAPIRSAARRVPDRGGRGSLGVRKTIEKKSFRSSFAAARR